MQFVVILLCEMDDLAKMRKNLGACLPSNLRTLSIASRNCSSWGSRMQVQQLCTKSHTESRHAILAAEFLEGDDKPAVFCRIGWGIFDTVPP